MLDGEVRPEMEAETRQREKDGVTVTPAEGFIFPVAFLLSLSVKRSNLIYLAVMRTQSKGQQPGSGKRVMLHVPSGTVEILRDEQITQL